MEMELVTQQGQKTRVDKIVQFQLSVGSDVAQAYFNIAFRVGDEDIGEQFDPAAPVTIPVAEIQEELKRIFEKALDLRAQQIEGESSIKYNPDYKSFFNELLTLPIFQLAQSQNREDLVLNAAYTDFSVILSNAISGAENVAALQASFDAVLEGLVFGEGEREEYLEPLRDAIARCNIPLSIKNPEAA